MTKMIALILISGLSWSDQIRYTLVTESPEYERIVFVNMRFLTNPVDGFEEVYGTYRVLITRYELGERLYIERLLQGTEGKPLGIEWSRRIDLNEIMYDCDTYGYGFSEFRWVSDRSFSFLFYEIPVTVQDIHNDTVLISRSCP